MSEIQLYTALYLHGNKLVHAYIVFCACCRNVHKLSSWDDHSHMKVQKALSHDIKSFISQAREVSDGSCV